MSDVVESTKPQDTKVYFGSYNERRKLVAQMKKLGYSKKAIEGVLNVY